MNHSKPIVLVFVVMMILSPHLFAADIAIGELQEFSGVVLNDQWETGSESDCQGCDNKFVLMMPCPFLPTREKPCDNSLLLDTVSNSYSLADLFLGYQSTSVPLESYINRYVSIKGRKVSVAVEDSLGWPSCSQCLLGKKSGEWVHVEEIRDAPITTTPFITQVKEWPNYAVTAYPVDIPYNVYRYGLKDQLGKKVTFFGNAYKLERGKEGGIAGHSNLENYVMDGEHPRFLNYYCLFLDGADRIALKKYPEALYKISPQAKYIVTGTVRRDAWIIRNCDQRLQISCGIRIGYCLDVEDVRVDWGFERTQEKSSR